MYSKQIITQRAAVRKRQSEPVNKPPDLIYSVRHQPSLQNNNQQHQHNNQHHNRPHLPPLPAARGIPRHPAHLPPGPLQRAQLAVGGALALVQHQHVLVELVADAQRQLALPLDRRAQRIQLRVLVGQDLSVVGVDLGVGQILRGDVVPVAGRVVILGLCCCGLRVVAVGEELGAGLLRFEVGGRGGEANGFLLLLGGGRLGCWGGGGLWFGGGGLGVGEVGCERGVVGVGEGGGGGGGGDAVELGG